MKRLFSNLVLLFGILGVISAYSYYMITEPWVYKCLQVDSSLLLVYMRYFLGIFGAIGPLIGILLFPFSEKGKKRSIGLGLIACTILSLFYSELVFTLPACVLS